MIQKLPAAIQQYFDALSYGLEALLPPCRVQNKAFLLTLDEVLQNEPFLTVPDFEHLKTLMAMADKIEFPQIQDVKSFCEAESFLIRTYPRFSPKQIRLSLQWTFMLLARHGRVEADLPRVEQWFRIWRQVQACHPIEQGFLSDLIRWMEKKLFSPQSILDTIAEYRTLKRWMMDHDFQSLGQLGNVEVQRYLLSRALGYQNSSKQKILGNARTILHYYKEAIDGGYLIPDFTVTAPRTVGINASANSREIRLLWNALRGNQIKPIPALMLVLILGYGLPLKALPLLKLSDCPGKLTYEERLPCRRGTQEREIFLHLDAPWLVTLWETYLSFRVVPSEYPYLFISAHGIRRKRPVSVDYCQRYVQASVHSVLGYSIPVNHLERGTLKHLALQNPLMEFMRLTAKAPKSRLSRFMYWLNRGTHG